MPSDTARLQRACACDPSCAFACLWAWPGSCTESESLGIELLSSMFETGGLLFLHFYYPPAGQSGEYFRWKDLMCVFVQPCTTNEHKAAIRECGQRAPKVQPGVQRVGPVCQLDSENNWPVRPLMQLDNTDLKPTWHMRLYRIPPCPQRSGIPWPG